MVGSCCPGWQGTDVNEGAGGVIYHRGGDFTGSGRTPPAPVILAAAGFQSPQAPAFSSPAGIQSPQAPSFSPQRESRALANVVLDLAWEYRTRPGITPARSRHLNREWRIERPRIPVILAAAGIQSPQAPSFSPPRESRALVVVRPGMVRRTRPGITPARVRHLNRVYTLKGLWIPVATRMTGGGTKGSGFPLRRE